MDKQNLSVQMNYVPFAFGQAGVSDRKRYLDALRSELESVGDYAERFAVDAVCITGINPLQYRALKLMENIAILKKVLPFTKKPEITVNVLPGTVTFAELHRLCDSRITRISFDMQSFVPAELDALGRTYAVRSIEVFMRMAQKDVLFYNFDVTLYFGLPGQTPDSFRFSVEQAIRNNACHITILPYGGNESPELKNFYQEGVDIIGLTQFQQYTPYHFARPGCISRWNQMTYAAQPRLGFGVGTSWMVDGMRCINTSDVAKYMDAQGDPSATIDKVETINQSEIETYALLDKLFNLGDGDLTIISPELRLKVNALGEDGLLVVDGDNARLSADGKAGWGSVVTALTI